MSPPTWEIREGDVLDRLREMPDESVHCVVTSPPYWGLRDYGTATWEGGDTGCDHTKPDRQGITGERANRTTGHDDIYRAACPCGAKRTDKQLGLEPTPEEYVEKMVEVFREVRRVMRNDAVCWLNLGDSYAGSWKNQGRKEERGEQRPITGPMIQSFDSHPTPTSNAGVVPTGLKPKDLVGIPWRVAFALQADGWWLRSDVIWHKPNPMPESVTDRPTKAHEYVFLLTKSATYFYDADAVREPNSQSTTDRWGARTERVGEPGSAPERNDSGGSGEQMCGANPDGRNRRTVWTITTKPYPQAHFATFPPELPRICIKAGTSERGCCAECGAPWERVVERVAMEIRPGPSREAQEAQGLRTQTSGTVTKAPTSKTTGWQPTCDHETGTVPCVVLDPFAGAGTTGVEALALGRSFIGIELNPTYAKMARARIDDDCPLFNREAS